MKHGSTRQKQAGDEEKKERGEGLADFQVKVICYLQSSTQKPSDPGYLILICIQHTHPITIAI
jgi:hypothetical protein